jgi:hypothetical protein
MVAAAAVAAAIAVAMSTVFLFVVGGARILSDARRLQKA